MLWHLCKEVLRVCHNFVWVLPLVELWIAGLIYGFVRDVFAKPSRRALLAVGSPADGPDRATVATVENSSRSLREREIVRLSYS